MVGMSDAARNDEVEDVQGEPNLLLDVFDVDQYGRLLVDVRGVSHGDQTINLARWNFAEECVGAGWGHTTPFHIVPDNVAAAHNAARDTRVGAWELETPERPFQG